MSWGLPELAGFLLAPNPHALNPQTAKTRALTEKQKHPIYFNGLLTLKQSDDSLYDNNWPSAVSNLGVVLIPQCWRWLQPLLDVAELCNFL